MLRKVISFSLLFFSGVFCLAAQESLLIGPGDQLHVQVFDTPEMDQHPRVTDAGTVPLMFIGDIKLSGLTPGEASRKVEATLKSEHYLLNPHVSVTMEDYGTQQVSVMGDVKSPGTYELTAPTPVIAVLAMAGGLTSLADRHITIQRRSNPSEHVKYFISNAPEAAFDSSVLIYPGDTILVPQVGLVYVIGDVARPGGYEISTNDGKLSVIQAIAMAGYTNKTALADGSKLIRKTDSGSTQQIPIRLASIEKGKVDDVSLSAGDVIFVPFSWMKNMAVNASTIAASTSGAAIYAAH